MFEASNVGQRRVPRVEYVTRLAATITKVNSTPGKDERTITNNVSSINLDNLQSASPSDLLAHPTSSTGNDKNSETLKTEGLLSSKSSSPSITKTMLFNSNNKKNNLIEQKYNLVYHFTIWFNQLPLKSKLLFVSVLAILSISLLAAAIIPPVYLFVIYRSNSQSSFTLKNVSSCSTSTCIGQETPYRSSIVSVLYPFDGNANDQSGYATGVTFGLTLPGYQPFSYIGQSISLTSTSQQYIQISSVDLAKKSFTLQMWLFPTSTNIIADFGLFRQCDISSICLSLSIRNMRIVLSFDSMNSNNSTLTSSSLVTVNSWVHITIVYDAILLQQQIYIDGLIDAVSSGMVGPYQGAFSSSTTTMIGRSSSYSHGNTYFNGRLDHFTISAGVARNACQIYNDASLVAYFPFDTTDTYNDRGVLLCNGVASGTTKISSGRVNQAISFTLSTSYFISECFPRMRASYESFSFSFWVNPTSTTSGGSLVHISSNADGSGTCYDHLVFTSTGALVFQWMISPTSVSSARGPVIPINTWTHISVVYSRTNGMRLFINGQYSTSSLNVGTLALHDNNSPMYITLGNRSLLGLAATFACPNGTISILPGPFSGSIDEFRMYNRELNNQEICFLAYP